MTKDGRPRMSVYSFLKQDAVKDIHSTERACGLRRGSIGDDTPLNEDLLPVGTSLKYDIDIVVSKHHISGVCM
tara:strand:- start:626 stop:844 length:219 start_codon:yes stop_codon:yes gene_type:complete